MEKFLFAKMIRVRPFGENKLRYALDKDSVEFQNRMRSIYRLIRPTS